MLRKLFTSSSTTELLLPISFPDTPAYTHFESKIHISAFAPSNCKRIFTHPATSISEGTVCVRRCGEMELPTVMILKGACAINKGTANHRNLWVFCPQQIKSKILECSRMHSKNSTMKCDCAEIRSGDARGPVSHSDCWESFQQANDTGLAHHQGLRQLFFSLYSRPKNWLVSIHYWSHQLQDLCLRPGCREGEWGNASVLANFTVFLERQTIMGEEVSIVVRVCPLEMILKSWPGQRRI